MTEVATAASKGPARSGDGPSPPSSVPLSAARDVGSVVEYLTRTGEMYKQHVELLRQRQAAREMEEAPFKPTVTPYAQAAAKKSVLRQSETIEERLHHLHEKRMERERQMREQHKAAEDAAVRALPFTPHITSRAAGMKRRGDVVETSARWQAERDAHVVAMQLQSMEAEASQLRERPRITAFAHEMAARERPPHMPVEDYLMLQEERRRRRQYALTELHWSGLDEWGDTAPLTGRADTSVRSARYGAVNASVASSSGGIGGLSSTSGPRKPFSPAISARAAGLHRPGDVAERLYRSSLEQTRAEEEVYDEVYQTHCTFHPHLSALSRQLSHSRYTDPAVRAQVVHERLHANPPAAPRHRKRRVVTAAEEEAARHPHRPQLSETSRAMVQAMRLRDGAESPASRLHRTGLEGRAGGGAGDASATGAVRRRTFKKPVVTPKEREAVEEVTFKPAVSARSEELWARKVHMLRRDGHARSTEEARSLLWRQAQKQKESALRRQHALQEAGEMLECTFQPRAGRAPVGKFGYDPAHPLPVAERAQLWSEQKERRLAQLRAELAAEAEDDVGADCTFQPRVHAAFPLPRPTPPSEAEETFVQRQAEARRRREEAEQWWRGGAAWRGDKGSARGSPPTSVHSAAQDSERGGSPYAGSEESDDVFEPHYPSGSDEDDDDVFMPHHQQPQQPRAVAEHASLTMEGSRAGAAPRPTAAVPFRSVPATREAERRKPSPLDAYRRDSA